MSEKKDFKIVPIASSSPFIAAKYQAGLQVLAKMNLRTALAMPLRKTEVAYLNGTDAERLKELNAALNTGKKTIVWAVRGGYGVTRILSQIKIAKKKQIPIVVGFSDVSALMLHLWKKFKAKSLHAATITRLPEEPKETIEALKLILNGEAPSVKYPAIAIYGHHKKKTVTGILLPCNLCMLTSLIGTKSMPSLSGSILLLEDVGEYPFRLDRMLTQLKQSSSLKKVKAVVIGYMTTPNREDNFKVETNLSLETLVNFFKVEKIPVFGQMPVGHESPNWPVPFGVKAKIEIHKTKAHLTVLENIF